MSISVLMEVAAGHEETSPAMRATLCQLLDANKHPSPDGVGSTGLILSTALLGGYIS